MLIISQTALNQILPVINVLPITSRKPNRRVYPNESLLAADTANLLNESLVLCFQIRTLDKKRLSRLIGDVTDALIQEQIVEALRFQLEIC